MSTTVTAVEQHAHWCSGGCPRWLASGAPGCLPIPCQCAATKAYAAEHYPWSLPDPKCWWRTKTGKIKSRCPCWGGPRDSRPGDCCAHHSANPFYLLTTDGLIADSDTVLQQAAEPAEPGDDRPADLDAIVWDDDQPYGPDPRHRAEPYIRRWPAELLSCPCDPKALPKGVHCGACCRTFANEMAHGMHRRDSTCTDPGAVRDVDSGAPLLISDGRVWRMHWHTHPGCCPTWNLAGAH